MDSDGYDDYVDAGFIPALAVEDDFTWAFWGKTLSQATATTQTLWDAAHEVFTSWHERQAGALRLIGFGVSSLQIGSGQQQELFPDPQEQKQRQVDETLDAIHKRFGKDALRRGQ